MEISLLNFPERKLWTLTEFFFFSHGGNYSFGRDWLLVKELKFSCFSLMVIQ